MSNPAFLPMLRVDFPTGERFPELPGGSYALGGVYDMLPMLPAGFADNVTSGFPGESYRLGRENDGEGAFPEGFDGEDIDPSKVVFMLLAIFFEGAFDGAPTGRAGARDIIILVGAFVGRLAGRAGAGDIIFLVGAFVGRLTGFVGVRDIIIDITIFLVGTAVGTPPGLAGAGDIIIDITIFLVGTAVGTPPGLAGAGVIIIITDVIFIVGLRVGIIDIILIPVGTTVEVPMTGDADGAGEGTLMTGFADAVVGVADGALSTGLGDETTVGPFVDNGNNDFGIGIEVGPGGLPPSPRGKMIAPARMAGFNIGEPEEPEASGCRERRLNTFRIGDALVGIAVSTGWGAEVGDDEAICGAILGNDEVDGFQLGSIDILGAGENDGSVLGRDDTLGADEEVGRLLGNNDGTAG